MSPEKRERASSDERDKTSAAGAFREACQMFGEKYDKGGERSDERSGKGSESRA